MPGELWVRYVVRAPQTDRAAVAAVAATLIISLAGGVVAAATTQMITFIFSERIPNCANANTSC